MLEVQKKREGEEWVMEIEGVEPKLLPQVRACRVPPPSLELFLQQLGGLVAGLLTACTFAGHVIEIGSPSC